MEDKGREKLDPAYEGLEHEVPDRMRRAIRGLRDPHSKWIRLPIGLLLIAGGIFDFPVARRTSSDTSSERALSSALVTSGSLISINA